MGTSSSPPPSDTQRRSDVARGSQSKTARPTRDRSTSSVEEERRRRREKHVDRRRRSISGSDDDRHARHSHRRNHSRTREEGGKQPLGRSRRETPEPRAKHRWNISTERRRSTSPERRRSPPRDPPRDRDKRRYRSRDRRRQEEVVAADSTDRKPVDDSPEQRAPPPKGYPRRNRRDPERSPEPPKRRNRSADRERDGRRLRGRSTSRDSSRGRSPDHERRRHRRGDDSADRRYRLSASPPPHQSQKRRGRSPSRDPSPSPPRHHRRHGYSPTPDRSKRRRRHSPSPSRSPSPPPRQPRTRKPLPDQELAFRGTDNSSLRPTKDGGAPPDKEKPNFAPTGLLARQANLVQGTGIALKYHEPPEARKPPPSQQWRLFVFKGKETLGTHELHTQSCWLLGRAAQVADIVLAHPSCSSQHAVIQFRYVQKKEKDQLDVLGLKIEGKVKGRVRPYLIDLESSNGTELNGERVDAGRYVELREGDVLKFGASEREYVVMLPPAEG